MKQFTNSFLAVRVCNIRGDLHAVSTVTVVNSLGALALFQLSTALYIHVHAAQTF